MSQRQFSHFIIVVVIISISLLIIIIFPSYILIYLSILDVYYSTTITVILVGIMVD